MGWIRRGDRPEFERWLFGPLALRPGQLSPVVETPFGYHILRIDRVQTGQVRASQIMLSPKIDSTDIARTAVLADSVAAMWKAGVAFDSLSKKYHDYAAKEETSLLTPFERGKLPPSYQEGFAGKKANDITVFRIPGAGDIPKFVVAQLVTIDEGGERTLSEMRETVRNNLAERGAVRRYIDALKRQTYVSMRLDKVDGCPAAKP
jgi:peptidyl-prolyl cis-trans isomerase SurA